MKINLIAFLIATIGLSPLYAQSEGKNIKIGLALSGGGARGIAHIGVLKAFEEYGIPIHYIAGTSMGAVVGSFYASGYDADSLETIFKTTDWFAIFSNKPERPLIPLSRRLNQIPAIFQLGFDFWKIELPEAALSDYRINRILIKYLSRAGFQAGRNFDHLPIPFRAVATDLKTGQRVILSRGNLSRAVRASISIPLLFPPVELDDLVLVDGGLADNIPVDVVKQMGPDLVIAVDVTSPPLERTMYQDIIGIANQLTDLLSSSRNMAYFQSPDILIKPDLHKHNFADYSKIDSLIAWGYEAAIKVVPQIKAHILHGMTNHKTTEQDKALSFDGRFIKTINIYGNRYLRQSIIRREFGLRIGEKFQLNEAIHGMDVVYATGFFKTCWLDFFPKDSSGIEIDLHVKEAIRRTIEIGLGYNDDDRAKGFLRFQNRNLFGWGERAQLNVYGSDAGAGLRIRVQGDRFWNIYLGYLVQFFLERNKPKFFQNHDYVNRAEFDHLGTKFLINVHMGRPGLFQGGFEIERVKIQERIGLNFAPQTDQLRKLKLALFWDSLDDLSFPTEGIKLAITYDWNLKKLGGINNFWQLAFLFKAAFSFHKQHVLEPGLWVGLSDEILPVYEKFRLGGPYFMPGLHRDELWNNQVLAAYLAYHFHLKPRLRLSLLTSAGNSWQQRNAIRLNSLIIGAGASVEYLTPLGPIGISIGINKRGDHRVYFSVGF